MGTRSLIGVMHGDNCKFVYCHWDGYPEHNGKILLENYDSSKANHLVSLGGISSLNRLIEIPDGVEHTFNDPAAGVTVFYNRDRGDEGMEFQSVNNFDAFLKEVSDSWAEYYYIMQDGEWFVGSVYGPLKYRLTRLSTVLAMETEALV